LTNPVNKDFRRQYRVLLGAKHRPTGSTLHYRDGMLLGPPSELLIGYFDGSGGFYLLYLDGYGEEMTDTYHESVDKAMEQAQVEFGVTPDEWKRLVAEFG
jgi:hypothetical protein